MNAESPIELPPARHGGAVVMKESIVITVAKGAEGDALIYMGDTTSSDQLLKGANPVEHEENLAR
jgi:hypothetical protein